MKKRMKILIAHDGSTYADDALIDLRRAGLPPIAEVLVVNVAEVWLPLPVGHESAKTVAATAETNVPSSVHSQNDRPVKTSETPPLVMEATERLKSFFPEWEINTETLRGSPAAAVIRRAKEWNADLLVAGSRGKSEFHRVWLGSVSQKIANEAPCSVRVTRSHGVWKSGAPVRILIGLDGSKAAEAAVVEVAGRFWMLGSEVRLVVALDKPDPALKRPLHKFTDSDLSGSEGVQVGWISEFVDRASQRLSAAELHVSQLIEQGDPKQIIVAEAEEWGADCIFVGAGENGSRTNKFLLGSVSTAIVARAHCTVEIVRK
jgi:nucleotide-binding universal stress UspA family protein